MVEELYNVYVCALFIIKILLYNCALAERSSCCDEDYTKKKKGWCDEECEEKAASICFFVVK